MSKHSIKISNIKERVEFKIYDINGRKVLENKISSPEGRFKEKKKITKEELDKIKKVGYSDNLYSSCHPKLYVTYYREYYNCNGSRLTIDTNISYKDYQNKNLLRKDTSIAVEIKKTSKQTFKKYVI